MGAQNGSGGSSKNAHGDRPRQKEAKAQATDKAAIEAEAHVIMRKEIRVAEAIHKHITNVLGE